MSSDSFAGCPSPKRFRPDNGPYPESMCSEGTERFKEMDMGPSGSIFRSREIRHFDGLSHKDECAVEGGNSSRHLCSSPQYATAAVTHKNDTELLSNGDSGFQELNMPDEISLDMNENNLANKVITNIDVDQPIANNLNTDQSTQDKELNDDDSISEISCVSDLSNLSGEDWKPIDSHVKWVYRQMESGANPKEIIRHLTGDILPDEIDDISALRFILRMLSEPNIRPKLSTVNTIDNVIELIQKSSKIIVLTGAGVSVSCGIPDFRSRNGIYARLSKDYPDLPDPQSMFDIRYFKRNPYPFFKFAKEIYPGQFSPSPSHKFIKYIEIKDKLLRNYSQNIDTLEKTAGIDRVITCHGSFATATCTNCGYKVDSNAIKSDIFAQHIPLCPKCNDQNTTDSSIMSVMKPDIVFFGEGLSDDFHNSMTIDKDECDLLIVMGSSLKVRPVALIPHSIPENIPQILINREPLNHLNFDVELLGDCDVIVQHLCERLGSDWSKFCFSDSSSNDSSNNENSFHLIPPSRYIFKGAELNDIENEDSDSYDSDEEEELSGNFKDSSANMNKSNEENIDIEAKSSRQLNQVEINLSGECVEKTNFSDTIKNLPTKISTHSSTSDNHCLIEKNDGTDNYTVNLL